MQFERNGWFEPYESLGENEGKEVCVKFNEVRHMLELGMSSETNFNIEQIEVPIGNGQIAIKEGFIHFPHVITMEEAQSQCLNNESLKIMVEYSRPSCSATSWVEERKWDVAPDFGGELTGRARLVSKEAWRQVIPNLPIAEIIMS